MVIRIFLFALLALGSAAVGVIAWTMMPGAAPATATAAAPPPPTKLTVLTAAHPLRAGMLIKPEDLGTQVVASADVPAGASQDTPQGRGALIGAMVRKTLGENQVILPDQVVRQGDHGFLAAVLGPGMRAVTVAVDAVSGTAGLIWPGDRVDVILTEQLTDPTIAAGRRVAAQTVLSGARVIAIDQQLMQGQAPDSTTPAADRTATLEVTAAQAERVLVAAKLGHLSLSVLSAEHDPVMQTASDGEAPRTVTWAGDVSPALGNTEARTTQPLVHVYQGGADGKEFHF